MATEGDAKSANTLDSAVTEAEKRRFDFLQKMYVQMFDDIKIQMQVVWQSVTIVAGTLSVFALVEKNVLPIDFATSFVVIIAFWLMAHTIEAAYWYNRNLVIIANIERQFLRISDLKEIHYYFGKHRDKNKMIDHLKIQFIFGATVGSFAVIYHFVTYVIPGFELPWEYFVPRRALPYFMGIVGIIFISRTHRDRRLKYQEFLDNSPGIELNTSGIRYGIGHPAYHSPTATPPPSSATNSVS